MLHLYHLSSFWSFSFNISCKTRIDVRFSQFLSRKVFISLSLLNNFAWHRIIGYWFVDFLNCSILNISFYCLLACMVSENKSNSYPCFSITKVCFFLFSFFSVNYLCLWFFSTLNIICLGVHFWVVFFFHVLFVFMFYVLLAYWIYILLSVINVRKTSVIIASLISSVPFCLFFLSSIPIMCMLHLSFYNDSVTQFLDIMFFIVFG